MQGIRKDDQVIKNILDDRVVCGLSGTDKIALIVKLQAIARGFITRK